MRAHNAFEFLLPVRDFADTLGVTWWIAGGWATDLFLGRVTRDHSDVDMLVLDRDQAKLRTLWLEGRLERRHKGELADWHADDVLVAGPDLLQPAGGSARPALSRARGQPPYPRTVQSGVR